MLCFEFHFLKFILEFHNMLTVMHLSYSYIKRMSLSNRIFENVRLG